MGVLNPLSNESNNSFEKILENEISKYGEDLVNLSKKWKLFLYSKYPTQTVLRHDAGNKQGVGMSGEMGYRSQFKLVISQIKNLASERYNGLDDAVCDVYVNDIEKALDRILLTLHGLVKQSNPSEQSRFNKDISDVEVLKEHLHDVFDIRTVFFSISEVDAVSEEFFESTILQKKHRELSVQEADRLANVLGTQIKDLDIPNLHVNETVDQGQEILKQEKPTMQAGFSFIPSNN